MFDHIKYKMVTVCKYLQPFKKLLFFQKKLIIILVILKEK